MWTLWFTASLKAKVYVKPSRTSFFRDHIGEHYRLIRSEAIMGRSVRFTSQMIPKIILSTGVKPLSKTIYKDYIQ